MEQHYATLKGDLPPFGLRSDLKPPLPKPPAAETGSPVSEKGSPASEIGRWFGGRVLQRA
ncbi:MAG: hypothetical protein LBT62_06585 [Deltaproteobacteria bacterium]|nr:hypothetical protein [Deltaproteobacteria bacterium]